MATLLHSESRRLYSWWWDSHISPKNSKWLQENLTDMDAKVKAMIKLIEEDADSFARRAEMYYKKRPELMKLVEEFYRAYRALAERYDHATVELRQAHHTMAEAFPNQVPYKPADDSPSDSSGLECDPYTPELPNPIRALLDPDDLHKDAFASLHSVKSNRGYPEESESGISKRGLKQLNEMFGEGKLKKGLKFHEETAEETRRQAETEVQTLKKTLAEIQAEKEAVLLQYQQSLQKLSSLERELKDAGGLDERASRAEIEVKILREALVKLEAERDAGLLQYNNCLERISILESMISQAQQEAKGLNDRATKAEVEAQNLKGELLGLEAEKEACLLQNNQCLEMISSLENRISLAEKNSRMINERTERAEAEVKALKEALAKLNGEKEAADLHYDQCLERIAKLESEISQAQEDVERLNSEVLIGAAKLKTMEENCSMLDRSNQILQQEAENLAGKITKKDQELSEKENKLEKLQISLQDEHSRLVHVEATLQTLQNLHSQSQEEQQALALELESRLQMLKELELHKHDLQNDLQRTKEENHSLNELNRSSSATILNLQNETSSLKEIKDKLEQEVSLQLSQSNSLQLEIQHLREEIECLSKNYQALLEQVWSVGLNPECLGASVKDLQDENLNLKEVCKKDRDEKEGLYGKLDDMNKILEKNVALERSLSELNDKLEGSREKVMELQESKRFLQGEKFSVVAEKSVLLSQLQIMTENIQKLLEKNALLENSLSGARIELEGLQTKSKSLEELCQTLKDEKSNILNERSMLVSQLESVEQRLGNLEGRFTRLEEKYSDLEREKQSTACEVKELWGFLDVERQERASYIQSSESRMGDLENQIHLLQEEGRLSKKKFEEELDKAVKAQVEIFILQKFIADLEEKNLSLMMQCQKHAEASKLSDKMISELETENLEQQVELEFLLDEIEKLRIGICQVFKALQSDPVKESKDGIRKEYIPIVRVLDNIEELKDSLLKNEDEKQQLVVENLVLLTLLRQLKSESVELKSDKNDLEQELMIFTEQCTILQKDNHELLEMNRQLRLEVSSGEQWEADLKTQLECQHVNMVNLQSSYTALEEEKSKMVEENISLLQKLSDLKGKMCVLEEENSSILEELVSLGNLSLVLESFGTEKAEELKAFSEDLNYLHVINGDLRKKVELLGEKMEMKEAETRHHNETIKKLQRELHEDKDLTDQLTCQILIGNDFLKQKAMELVEVEQKLMAAHSFNAELHTTIEKLKRECKESKLVRESKENEILKLSQDSINQNDHIEFLHEANKVLKSEVDILRDEVEERRAREKSLSLELQERSNEIGLWEAEASSFYFDFQISSIREVLLENKLQELTAVCENLKDENAMKNIKIEQMEERSGLLEGEIGGLKAQLCAYIPVVASLRDNVESFERNTLLRLKLIVEGDQGHKDVEMVGQPHEMNRCQSILDEGALVTDGISDLLNMQTRIKEVEKVVVKEMDKCAAERTAMKDADRLEMCETVSTNIEVEAPVEGAGQLEMRERSNGLHDTPGEELELENEAADVAELQKSKSEISELKNGILMKDIPLDQVSDCSLYKTSKRRIVGADDQMLKLWESAEQDCNLNPRASDAQKQAAALSEDVCTSQQFIDAKQKTQNPSLELQVEKELGVDKLEVSTSTGRESNQEGNEGKILERLASDDQKLISLQTAVQDLKKKMERKKNKKSKNCNDLEFEKVKRQLQEVEEAVVQLVDTNDQLANNIQDCPGNSSAGLEDVHRKKVIEQAQKGSEKISRLQFEVQSIQYILLKLEDENKSKSSKHRFPGNRTGIFLRNFIYNGRRSSRRRKRGCFSACGRPSSVED